MQKLSAQVLPTVLFSLLLPSLLLIGIVGNALVIIVVLTSRKMRASTMNLLMVNLGVADMVNLIATAPDWILILVHRHAPELICL